VVIARRMKRSVKRMLCCSFYELPREEG